MFLEQLDLTYVSPKLVDLLRFYVSAPLNESRRFFTDEYSEDESEILVQLLRDLSKMDI